MNVTEPDCDVLLVGAGLANSLIALELDKRRPDLSVVLLDGEVPERDHDHTWCIFQTDMSSEAWRAYSPGFDKVWDGYRVLFPARERELTTAYGCLTEAGLARMLAERPRLKIRRSCATSVEPTRVVLENGEHLAAKVVIDGRGARRSAHIGLGFQKFLGLEVRLRHPHGLTGPVLKDATVRQVDGYRFIYLLPLGEDRLLVEDTRYSDGPALDAVDLERAVLRYIRAQGWVVAEVFRRERGVLPVALDGDPRAYFAEIGGSAAQVGMRGLFFHPTTGYSFPDALRVADLVAAHIDLGGSQLAARLRNEAIRLWEERSFYRLLNRMLFHAAEPTERYRVLERFYGLPQPLIERFYAGAATWADKARVLSGKPPVPLWRALKAMTATRTGEHHANA